MEIVHEEWRSVVGKFAGWNYEVSNLGRMRSTSTYRPSLHNKILAQFVSNAGYFIRRISNKNKGVNVNVHILVCEAFHGLRPPGMEVNHKDGDKKNNRADNLEWQSDSGNMRHAIDAGLKSIHRGGTPALQGEKNPACKLSNAQVEQIREEWRRGGNRSEMARRYGVRRETIWAIATGKKRK